MLPPPAPAPRVALVNRLQVPRGPSSAVELSTARMDPSSRSPSASRTRPSRTGTVDAIVLVGQDVVAPRADVRRGDPSAGGFAMGD